MKFLSVFVLIAVTVAASAQRNYFPTLDDIARELINRSRVQINKWVIELIEGQRDNLKTGWPALGIAPLDPLYIEDFEIDFDQLGNLGGIDIHLTDSYLIGLSDFNVEDVDLQVFGLHAEATLTFHRLEIIGQHETTARLSGLPIHGKGDIDLIFHEVTVNVLIQMFPQPDNTLALETLHVGIHIGRIESHLKGFGLLIDPVVNLAIESTLATVINETDKIVDLLLEVLVLPINAALGQLTLPRFLIAIIEYVQGLY